MKIIKLVAVCILLSLLILSCSDESIFPSLQAESSSVSIEINNPDTCLDQGDVLDFSIVNKQEIQTDQQFVAKLFSSDDVLVAEKLVDDLEIINYSPEIEIPPLEDGFYYFNCTVVSGEEELVSIRKEFFVYSEPAEIGGLSSYPPVIFPGGGGLVYALVSDNNSNPYMRWSMGGNAYIEGYFLDGTDSLQWQAPSQDGIYKMAVELFPGPVPADFTQPLQGVSYSETQLFVNKKQKADKNELQPLEGSFSSLFHFRGEFQDYEHDGDLAEALGTPEIAFRNRIFGYELDNSDGFRMDYSVISLEEDELQPFTLFFKGIISVPEQKAYLLRSAADDAELELYFNDEGFLSALVASGGIEYTSSLQEAGIPEGMKNLALSIIPQENESTGYVLFRWFVNGKQIFQERAEAMDSFRDSADGEWTIIGGEQGVSTLIDEFAVYNKDSSGKYAASPAVFLAAAAETYEDKLLFADGFDGTELLQKYDSDRNVSLSGGSLIIEPAEYIQISKLFPAEAASFIDIIWTGAEEGSISYNFSSGLETAVISFDYEEEKIFIPGYPDGLSFSSGTEQKISLAVKENRLIYELGGNEYPVLDLDQEGFYLEITNTGKETYFLDDIVVISEFEAIIERNQVLDTELL